MKSTVFIFAADLAFLTDALDEPRTDISETLRAFTANAKAAVGSYLGVTVSVTGLDGVSGITALDEGGDPAAAQTSLRIVLPLQPAFSSSGRHVALTLYARAPGAFIDLAADLAWLTGTELPAFILDQDLPLEVPAALELAARSDIDQAIGMLIGRGFSPERAKKSLADAATSGGTSLHAAARGVLMTPFRDDPFAAG